MNNKLAAAGTGLLMAIASCAPSIQSQIRRDPPSSQQSLAAICSSDVSSIKSLLKDPTLKQGFEIKVPSDDYLSCMKAEFAAQKDGKYLIVPTDTSGIYKVLKYDK